jgi:hypothetical protein
LSITGNQNLSVRRKGKGDYWANVAIEGAQKVTAVVCIPDTDNTVIGTRCYHRSIQRICYTANTTFVSIARKLEVSGAGINDD